MKQRTRGFRYYGAFLLASVGLAPVAFSACSSGGNTREATGGAHASGGNDAGNTEGGTGTGGAATARGGTTSGGDWGGGGDGPAHGIVRCTQSRPLIQARETGFFKCGSDWDTFIHRSSLAECPSNVPRADHTLPPTLTDGSAGAGGTSGSGECLRDRDCTEKPLGFCVPPLDYSWEGPFINTCRYGCLTDDQCGAAELCLCGDPVGQCVPASCKTDASCTDGALCSSYDIIDQCKVWLGYGFACQDPLDECTGSCDGYCVQKTNHRLCESGASGCGG